MESNRTRAMERMRMLRVAAAAASVGALVVGCAQPSVIAMPQPPQPAAGSSRGALFHEPFQRLDATRWREIKMKGRTSYSIEESGGSPSLKVHSRSGASILVHPLEFDVREYPWLSWRWRVDRLVEGEDLKRRKGSDASARVYVYFDAGGTPWQKPNLDYVWSRALPVGTELDSAYSSLSKIIVVESGSEHLGQWRAMRRNLLEDYRRLFGEDPPKAVAVGLMVDSDNTRSTATARFDDVRISREPPAEPGK